MIRNTLFIGLLVFGINYTAAQCGLNYDQSVRRILEISRNKADVPGRPRLVLAGSSTFTSWSDVKGSFPNYNVINAGIGGSCFNDLLAYRTPLLFETRPDVLVIYEGDNDLAFGMPVHEVVKNAELLIAWFIVRTNGEVPVVIVGPKPSPSRSKLAPKFEVLNNELKRLAFSYGAVYVDTWKALCSPNGQIVPHYYKSDQLHLNARGNAVLARAMNEVLETVHFVPN